MTHAVRVHKYGGPEVLIFEEVDVGRPGPGEVRLRQHAIGVNFVDVYQRSGLTNSRAFRPFLVQKARVRLSKSVRASKR